MWCTVLWAPSSVRICICLIRELLAAAMLITEIGRRTPMASNPGAPRPMDSNRVQRKLAGRHTWLVRRVWEKQGCALYHELCSNTSMIVYCAVRNADLISIWRLHTGKANRTRCRDVGLEWHGWDGCQVQTVHNMHKAHKEGTMSPIKMREGCCKR